MYLGDFNPGDVVDFKFTTFDSTGAPITLAGSPAVSVYQTNSTTESTAGVTLTTDFDSRTGMHHVRITTVTDGSFYAAARDFQVVITTGTVNSVSVVGYVLREFSIQNRNYLRPTTAGRTLDVSAGGEAGVDWANVGSPTTSNALSGTSVLLSSGTGTGQLDFTSGVVKANATQFAGQTITCSGGVTVPAATLASTTNITAGTITTVTTVTNQLTAAQIATGVWQDATAGDFTTASSIGKSLYTGNVAPGGSGGLLISGSNSGTTTLAALSVTGGITVSNSGGTAVTLAGSANGHGLVVQGNGTGNGMTAIGGATGAGIKATGGSTSGDAIYLTATSGYGVDAATIGFLGDIGGSMNGTVGSVTGSVGSVVTKTGYSLASTGLDLVLIDGIGLPTAVKYVAAATAGKSAVSGSTVTFTGIDGSTLHITATTDSNGQRTAVAYS